MSNEMRRTVLMAEHAVIRTHRLRRAKRRTDAMAGAIALGMVVLLITFAVAQRLTTEMALALGGLALLTLVTVIRVGIESVTECHLYTLGTERDQDGNETRTVVRASRNDGIARAGKSMG